MRLIDADKIVYSWTVDNDGEEHDGVTLQSIIHKMPTIDAEPARHGHWVFNPKDAIEMMFTLPICSECGAKSSDGGNYCHNCGARMNEDRDYERAVEQLEHDMAFEPTYNPEDGSM